MNLEFLPEWRDRNYKDYEIRRIHQSKSVKNASQEPPAISFEILGLSETKLLSAAIQLDYAASNLAVRCTNYEFDEWKFLAPSDGADVTIFWFPIFSISRGGIAIPSELISQVINSITVRLQMGISVYVLLPEPPISSLFPGDSLELSREEFSDNLQSQFREEKNVVFLSWESWIGVNNLSDWSAPRFWEIARMPGNPGLISHIAKSIGATTRNDFGFGIKAIAVDLDDTLWGGIIGDCGVEGVMLDQYGQGRSHLELQRFLIDQYKKGIFLGVISKNNQLVVDDAFENRNEMLLKKHQVAFWGVTWDKKSTSITKMAEHLNIHPTSIVFIDDSEYEISEVKSGHPGIQTIHFSGDEGVFLKTLQKTGLFQLTHKNPNRTSNFTTSVYQTETFPSELFKIAVKAFKLNLDHLDRAASLINKTNQFNLTSNRTNRSKLWEIAQNSNSRAIVYEVEENSHSKGIMSVIVIEKEFEDFIIKDWVLSCRAFSRGIEWWILRDIANELDLMGVSSIICNLKKTDKTSYIENFISDMRNAGLLDENNRIQIRDVLESGLISKTLGGLKGE